MNLSLKSEKVEQARPACTTEGYCRMCLLPASLGPIVPRKEIVGIALVQIEPTQPATSILDGRDRATRAPGLARAKGLPMRPRPSPEAPSSRWERDEGSRCRAWASSNRFARARSQTSSRVGPFRREPAATKTIQVAGGTRVASARRMWRRPRCIGIDQHLNCDSPHGHCGAPSLETARLHKPRGRRHGVG